MSLLQGITLAAALAGETTAPHAAMTHIAIQESVNGSPVTWMEKVTDEDYLAPVGKD